MKLMEGFDSNYRYILVAARRARQIQGGSRPMVETGSRKPCRIAQQEIDANRLKTVDQRFDAGAFGQPNRASRLLFCLYLCIRDYFGLAIS